MEKNIPLELVFTYWIQWKIVVHIAESHDMGSFLGMPPYNAGVTCNIYHKHQRCQHKPLWYPLVTELQSDKHASTNSLPPNTKLILDPFCQHALNQGFEPGYDVRNCQRSY